MTKRSRLPVQDENQEAGSSQQDKALGRCIEEH